LEDVVEQSHRLFLSLATDRLNPLGSASTGRAVCSSPAETILLRAIVTINPFSFIVFGRGVQLPTLGIAPYPPTTLATMPEPHARICSAIIQFRRRATRPSPQFRGAQRYWMS